MGDAEHLGVARQPLQPPPDDVGGVAADARVDLVEDQRRALAVRLGEGLDRQHQAREFAAGDDARQRAEVLAWVWRHKELYADQVLAGPHCSAGERLEPHVEARSPHRQLAQRRDQLARERVAAV